MKIRDFLMRALFVQEGPPEPQFYDWEVDGECDNRSHPLVLEEENHD